MKWVSFRSTPEAVAYAQEWVVPPGLPWRVVEVRYEDPLGAVLVLATGEEKRVGGFIAVEIMKRMERIKEEA